MSRTHRPSRGLRTVEIGVLSGLTSRHFPIRDENDDIREDMGYQDYTLAKRRQVRLWDETSTVEN
jgi:hypothetical protein